MNQGHTYGAEREGGYLWAPLADRGGRTHSSWLQDRNCTCRTQYLELTTLKQAVKWVIEEKMLPSARLIHLKLQKPGDTSTWRSSNAGMNQKKFLLTGEDGYVTVIA